MRWEPEHALDLLAGRAALDGVRPAILPPAVMLDGSVLRHAPRLRVVSRVSAGVGNIELEACTQAGVEVARASGARAAAEAEFVIGALLALLRGVPIVTDEGLLIGRELSACIVGIVGVTFAMSPLARMLFVFGTPVLGHDPGVHADDPRWFQAGVEPIPLLELMRDSDAVCVLMHHDSRFDGLFGERLLSAAKPNQVIVSQAHSALFDEHALAHALREGPMAAAWRDSV